MRVSGNSTGLGVSMQLGDGKPAGTSQPSVPSTPAAVDAVVVSSTAQFIAAAQAQVKDIPDVRTEKVEALKAMLDSDGYNPDPEAVADGLVKEYTPAWRE